MKSTDSFAAALAERQLPIRVIYVASYPPRICGIATFTKNLTTAINGLNPDALAEIIALNDNGQEYEYPWEVKVRIGQHRRSDYLLAARYINQSSADIVCVQHEFGLFGGPEGDSSTCLSAGLKVPESQLDKKHLKSRYYLMEMLERIEKPIVTTFHSILPDPDPHQRYIMGRIIERSQAVVAMTEDARKILTYTYDCPKNKAVVIYHGVPDFRFNDIARNKRRLRIMANPMILCTGLLGPGKGLEYVIKAMPNIVKAFPKARLYIVGRTHPGILKVEGESYREKLKSLAKSLRIRRYIHYVNRYVSDEELHSYYQAADFFITAYKALEQSGSGTLAEALGAGKVCLSTATKYAKEVLDDGAGILLERCDSSSISENVIAVYSDQKHMHELRERAYAKGRKFIWPNVALNYLNLFRLVLQTTAESSLGKESL